MENNFFNTVYGVKVEKESGDYLIKGYDYEVIKRFKSLYFNYKKTLPPTEIKKENKVENKTKQEINHYQKEQEQFFRGIKWKSY